MNSSLSFLPAYDGNIAMPTDSYEEHYPFYFIKDHLGNIRETFINPASNYKLSIQRIQYYPSGLMWNVSSGAIEHPYRYNGKELVQMHGQDEYDSKARWYYPVIMRTTTMDPMAEKYYHISPYAWCANNPIMLIDPDGLAWYLPNGLPVPTTISEWKERLTWTEYTSQETLTEAGIDGVYMGEAVVVFDGYYDEKLGKDGKLIDSDGRMPADAKMANVTVFGPNSKDDIADYLGYTMSSDPKRYGVLANGEYNVNRTSQLGPYESPWAIENRGKLPTLFDVNPAYPNRNPAFIEGVFVHKYNLNGKAGVYWDKDKNRWAGRSEGCLLIGPNKWGAFKRQLQQVNSFHLILNRQ